MRFRKISNGVPNDGASVVLFLHGSCRKPVRPLTQYTCRQDRFVPYSLHPRRRGVFLPHRLCLARVRKRDLNRLPNTKV
jgi:hypothetical protein